MAKYIERESLAADGWYLQRYISGDGYAYVQSMNIMDIPAADVAPVVRGKWLLEREPDGTPYCFHCSVCDDDFSIIGITTKYNFCPNCGALMDKDGDEK